LFPRAAHLLYRYCDVHHVPHARVGKLVLSRNADETKVLRGHMEHALASGVKDVTWLTGGEAREVEPNVECAAAFFSPSSGIVDSHALMLAYQAELENRGGSIAFCAPVLGGEVGSAGHRLEVGGAEPMTIACNLLVNCAGHGAPPLARSLANFPSSHVPRAFFRRGVYFSVNSRPFKHLVYPIHADTGGMDVHAVIDLGGNVRFGPDVEWIDGVDYTVDPRRADAFYASIRSFWPGLPDGALIPAYAGVRPKITGPGEPAADFMIEGPAEHGIPNLVNLFGIETPGLTSSLAIGEYVVGLLGIGTPTIE
jgi:L-2-hydroxyglutarate oxidase LhgO